MQTITKYIHSTPDRPCAGEEDAAETLWQYPPEEEGDVQTRCYQVFPGIELTYHDIHAKRCVTCRTACDSVFEIRHCREGRMEDGSAEGFYYMGPGDLSICRPEAGLRCWNYPLRHYHGITISVDVEQAPRCLSCLLDDVNVQPRLLMQKFCTAQSIFVARSQPAVAHIFSELYAVPEEIQKGYFKVKVLELLLFLSCLDVRSDESALRCCSNSQRLLAKQVCQYLTEHMEQRITLEQLADRFHVSGTQIKTSIKSVYGTSLYSFIRTQKMQFAAKLLRDTDMTVSEIAGQHGYDNASKFAGAFKAVMGMTPNEYRKMPVKVENQFV